MNNKILSHNIKEITYEKAFIIFDRIDRNFMPSLLTGEGPEDISKISIIGLNPVNNITITDNKSLWGRLRELNNSTNFHKKPYPINRIGAIGYISYEALHSVENITKKTKDHFTFPLLNWTLYKNYYYFDNQNRKAWYIKLTYASEELILGECDNGTDFKVSNLKPDFTPDEYRENVRKIRDLIFKGEVYEVNLTQGIKGDFNGSPYSLYKKLYKNNKAPYSAFMQREDYSIICNSPELYLRCDKNRVETRPIKGTAPRNDDKTIDKKLSDDLFNSGKNQAELFMIVDLMRNDISRVCKTGSVKVDIPKRIEEYKNVHHLVSIISGELADNKDYIDLLKATFPGGSITGCPKVRCLEITEKIEKSSRNLYTGTIFMMNRELLNSNIVIRSCVIKDNHIVLNSGGAITIDSDPDEEYKESLVKLKSLFKAVDCEGYI